MLALYKVFRADSHIITQIVETEFIVRSESDVCQISLAACVRVGLVTVDAVHAESVEHIKRSHPFGVTFSQIVVHGYYMYAVSGQGIQEYGKRSYKSLTFTGRHFGNFPFVQYYTAKQLYVVVNHVPYRVISTGIPMILPDGFVTFDAHEVFGSRQGAVEICSCNYYFFVFRETFGRFFHDGESYRQYFVKCFFVYL